MLTSEYVTRVVFLRYLVVIFYDICIYDCVYQRI